MGLAGKTAVVPIGTTAKSRQQRNTFGTAQRLASFLMCPGLAEQRSGNQRVARRKR